MVDEESAFTEFERRYRREYGVFYEFLAAFYGMQASAESYFWEAKKIINCPLSEFEAFVELVGGVASGEASLTRPDAVAEHLVSSSHSLATAADELAGRVGALHATDVVVNAMSEAARVQVQALLGADAGEEAIARRRTPVPSSCTTSGGPGAQGRACHRCRAVTALCACLCRWRWSRPSGVRSGTSRAICTAHDSNADHDERILRTPGSTISIEVVTDTGWRLLTRVERLQSYMIEKEVQRSDTLGQLPGSVPPSTDSPT